MSSNFQYQNAMAYLIVHVYVTRYRYGEIFSFSWAAWNKFIVHVMSTSVSRVYIYMHATSHVLSYVSKNVFSRLSSAGTPRYFPF